MDNLENRAKLYQKKSDARSDLKAMSIKKEGLNDFDHYTYFSEAQYKSIITNLLLAHQLELSGSVVSVDTIQGTPKQPIAARTIIAFTLIDLETGYSESVNSAGDGIDKGDKGIYKAMTGAFKYYMANNFHITTGDDAEKYDKVENEKPKTDIKKETASDYTEEKQDKIDYKSKLSETKRNNLIETVSAGAKIWKKTESILKQAKVESIDKLTDEQLLKTSAWLNEMGDKEV